MKIAIIALAGAAVAANASVIYDADFSQFVGIDHTSNGNALEASGQQGANFTIGYPSNPSSDTTRNFFETTGTSLISSDFGGDHFMFTDDIDVSGWNEISIDMLADFVGSASFNNSPTEFISYSYSLDGGSQQEFFSFTDDPNGPDLNASTVVDVSSASSLVVRIDANANGAGDGWELTQLEVNGTVAVPAPGSVALVGLAGLAAAGRRR